MENEEEPTNNDLKKGGMLSRRQISQVVYVTCLLGSESLRSFKSYR